MDTILLNNFNLEGNHGLTEKERNEIQRFRIDISLKTRSTAGFTDSIENALDYRLARRIVTDIVENRSFYLIETIANTIAKELLENTKAVSVTVTVRKMEIWGNANPGVSVTRDKVPAHLNLLNFDIENVFEDLCTFGGTSFPAIPEERRLKLLNEAQTYEYGRQPEIVGPAKVREQLSSTTEFLQESLFHSLRNDFTELLLRKFSSLPVRNILSVPLKFDEMSLQKYDTGSIGVTPHRDGKSKLNLICIFTLTGKAEVALCADRQGNNPNFLDVAPGNVTLLRGPGFLHSTFEPMHFVRNVTEERIVFSLRQNK